MVEKIQSEIANLTTNKFFNLNYNKIEITKFDIHRGYSYALTHLHADNTCQCYLNLSNKKCKK